MHRERPLRSDVIARNAAGSGRELRAGARSQVRWAFAARRFRARRARLCSTPVHGW